MSNTKRRKGYRKQRSNKDYETAFNNSFFRKSKRIPPPKDICIADRDPMRCMCEDCSEDTW